MLQSTTYVLHGGEGAVGLFDSQAFVQRLLRTDAAKLRVLGVYFAREQFDWEALGKSDSQCMRENTEKLLHFEIATLDRFAEQLERADIVLFKGGDGPRLTGALSQYSDLAERLKGKTIGAISAGAHALSTYYYSRRGSRVLPGLGILPLKVFTHYEPQLAEEYAALKNAGEDLEIITISEGEFRVLELPIR